MPTFTRTITRTTWVLTGTCIAVYVHLRLHMYTCSCICMSMHAYLQHAHTPMSTHYVLHPWQQDYHRLIILRIDKHLVVYVCARVHKYVCMHVQRVQLHACMDLFEAQIDRYKQIDRQVDKINRIDKYRETERRGGEVRRRRHGAIPGPGGSGCSSPGDSGLRPQAASGPGNWAGRPEESHHTLTMSDQGP